MKITKLRELIKKRDKIFNFMEKSAKVWKPNRNHELSIDVDGIKYDRIPVRTHLVMKEDNILDLVEKYLVPYLLKGDVIFISEQITAITQGRLILIRDIKPTSFARFLSRKVGVNFGTEKFHGFGLGTPQAMQLAIQEVGPLRIFIAAAIAAITKPFGIKGMFYRVIGDRAKAIDCPASYTLWPYHQYAKLAPLNPSEIAKSIKNKFGYDVVIIDANYRGAEVLGKSNRAISNDFAKKVFRDNPLGQGDEQTPLCIVRKSTL
jgi:hypothetical protein